MGFFPIIVIVISILCMIFLIAAVGAAATTFRQIASCQLLSDLSPAQTMPSRTSAAAFDGYQPSTGGMSLGRNEGSLYSVEQPGSGASRAVFNTAAGTNVVFAPSVGAAHIVSAIVLLLLFTIFFSIKTDWAAAAPSADDGSMMTPR